MVLYIDDEQLIYILYSSNSSANNHTDAKSKETCIHLDSTPSDERSDVVWIVVVTLLCVIIAFCTIFHWIKKRKDFQKSLNYHPRYTAFPNAEDTAELCCLKF